MKSSLDDGNIMDFLFEVGYLKRIPRSGWLFAGISFPESVADHSFRVTLIGLTLAILEGADCEKVMKMCILHDLAESKLLDLPARTKPYLPNKEDIELQIFHDITRELPDSIRTEFLSTFEEYIQNSSLESMIAHDADKLEMLLQAVEYKQQGYNTYEWIVDALTSLQTDIAKKIALTLISKFHIDI